MAERWMRKHLDTVEDGEWVSFAPNTLHYEWCCDCNLRHVHEYRVIKDKNGDLVCQRRFWRDSFATDLRRKYEKVRKG